MGRTLRSAAFDFDFESQGIRWLIFSNCNFQGSLQTISFKGGGRGRSPHIGYSVLRKATRSAFWSSVSSILKR